MNQVDITEAGRELAAELANAEWRHIGFVKQEHVKWSGVDCVPTDALARLASVHLAMKADWAEVAKLTDPDDPVFGAYRRIHELAARYMVGTDPLVEAWSACWPDDTSPAGSCERLRAELAKRGLTISKAKP